VSVHPFNELLRAAAGHAHAPIDGDRIGNVGIGRGGAAAARPPKLTNDAINEAIRAASRRATNRIDPLDGVSLDDVLFGG
jgi:hypothetical protein